VVRQFPGSGTSGVLSAESLVLYTNEPMNESTLASALHLVQNGQLVAGTLTSSADGRALVFRPLQPWAPNALIELYLDSNALDASGNALNSYQGQFRSAVDSLATPPQVIATSATSGLPTNAVVELGFNQSLNPATVSSSTVSLANYYTSQLVPSTVSLIKGGRVIRLVPQAGLAANSTYVLQFTSAIQDTDGQSAGNVCCYYLSTAPGAVADNVAPKVLSMSPPDGSTDVGINGHVHVRFSEPMDVLSLWPEQPQKVYESLFWSDNNTSTEFMPHEPYPVNTQVTESVEGVADLAGNGAAAPNSVTFTTGAGPDFTSPQITDGTPFNSATNVPVNPLIRLRFSEPLDPVSVNASGAYLYSNVDGAIAATATLEPDGRTLTYVPAQALAVNRSYTVYAYSLKDLAGNASYLSRSFTTGLAVDTQAPLVTGTSLVNGLTGAPTNAVLSVTFNEPINEQKLAGIALSQGGSPVATTAVLSGDHRIVTLTLKQLLQAQTGYVFTVSGVEDLSGNPLGSSTAVSFTTGTGLDLVAPTVLSRTPASGATGVPLNTSFEVQYSERLNPTLVSDLSARVYDGSLGQFLAGTASLSADGTTVRATPSVPLQPNHPYSLYVGYSSVLQDLGGNSAPSSVASFTTGAQ
jgi:hypothetical protein